MSNLDSQVLRAYLIRKIDISSQRACSELLMKYNTENFDTRKLYYENCLKKYESLNDRSLLQTGLSLDLEDVGADILS